MREFVLKAGEMQLILAGLRALREESLIHIETIEAGPEQYRWRKESYEPTSKNTLELIQSLLTGWHTKAKGICPVCNGFGLVRISEASRKWFPGEHFHKCTNCGGQYQGGIPYLDLGTVALRRDNGEPCSHNYSSKNVGRCLTEYVCKNCGDKHQIDSGD